MKDYVTRRYNAEAIVADKVKKLVESEWNDLDGTLETELTLMRKRLEDLSR